MLEPQQARRGPLVQDQVNIYGHSRSRTASSGAFPSQGQNLVPVQPAQRVAQMQHSRRSPSVNTFSTTSSFAQPPPAAYRTSSHTDLRRSTSSRSGGTSVAQPSSYVALLRKQKATVWCDRAQYEDPRAAAKQKAAKMRANLEVVGARSSTYGSLGPSAGRTSTGLSATGKLRTKIGSHGKTPVVGYAPGENHVGVGGVPLRLSATEVEAESSEEEEVPAVSRLHHRRTGSSGKSSTNSARRPLAYRASGASSGRNSRRWSPGDTPEGSGSMLGERPANDDGGSGRARSTASGSSAERADNVGELGTAPRMASNSLMHSALTREKSTKSPEELRRRGSVDERTATLTSGRLFIANPD